MISPCVNILRHLANAMHKVLGSDQGTEHQAPDLSDDIQRLMDSLDEAAVYHVHGRVFSNDVDLPTKDVLTIGQQALTQSRKNPLADYNCAFKRLQTRRRMQPVVGARMSKDAPAAWTPDSAIAPTMRTLACELFHLCLDLTTHV